MLVLCLVVQQPRSGVLVCVHFFCARGSLRSRTAESNSAHVRLPRAADTQGRRSGRRRTSLSAVAAQCTCTLVSHVSPCATLRVMCDTDRVHVLVLCLVVQQPRSGVLVCVHFFLRAGVAAKSHC